MRMYTGTIKGNKYCLTIKINHDRKLDYYESEWFTADGSGSVIDNFSRHFTDSYTIWSVKNLMRDIARENLS